MKHFLILVFLLTSVAAAAPFEQDTLHTASGDLVVTFIGHGTLMLNQNGTVIHVDPVGYYANYDSLPAADLILVTHQHGDHLDAKSIGKITTAATVLYINRAGFEQLGQGKVLANGDHAEYRGIGIDAVPAYNLVHKRDNGEFFHPRGMGNGYVLNFNGTRVYIAGDTENVPEMAGLAGVDVAFLPMNLPYTMTPEMNAAAVRMIEPKIYYPYHYGDTNLDELLNLLSGFNKTEIRIRPMK
jgi:L-ascorbate metabolism protein UlaG (beta-lactamase superfamily)